MSYTPQEIDEITNKLERVIDRLKERAVSWWWLDQGDAPIFSPFRVRIQGKKVEYERLPKVSVVVALRTIRDTLRSIKNLPEIERISVINDIAKDVQAIYNLIETIFDAQNVVNEIETLVEVSKKTKEKEAKLIHKQLISMLEEIKEIIKSNPNDWSGKKEEILSRIYQLKNKLETLRKAEVAVKVEEPKVTEKEEEEIEEILEDLKKYEEVSEEAEAEGA